MVMVHELVNPVQDRKRRQDYPYPRCLWGSCFDMIVIDTTAKEGKS